MAGGDDAKGVRGWLPWALLIAAQLLWAGNWVVARAMRLDVPPVAMAFWRWAIALMVLLPFTLPALRAAWPLVRREWRVLLLLGALATALNHVPIFIGLRETTSINGGLIYSTSPVFMLLLARLIHGERMSGSAIAGVLVALAGVLVIVSRGDLAALAALAVNRGDLWVVAGTLAWAGYTVCLRWRPGGLDPLVLLTLVALVGTVITLPLYAAEVALGYVANVGPGMVIGLLYLGLGATLLGFIAWNRGVDLVGSQRAAPFMYLMVVFTALLAMLFLDERLAAFHLIGFGLIGTGIWVTGRKRAR